MSDSDLDRYADIDRQTDVIEHCLDTSEGDVGMTPWPLVSALRFSGMM